MFVPIEFSESKGETFPVNQGATNNLVLLEVPVLSSIVISHLYPKETSYITVGTVVIFA